MINNPIPGFLFPFYLYIFVGAGRGRARVGVVRGVGASIFIYDTLY